MESSNPVKKTYRYRYRCLSCNKEFPLREDKILLCKTCFHKRMKKVVDADRRLLMRNNRRGETAADFARLFAISRPKAKKLWQEANKDK